MRTAPSPIEAPGFEGKRVITDKGEKGDANEAVIKALSAAGALIARGQLKHQYPHSWRSKKPVIFRNTPQWFLAMDQPIANAPHGQTLRAIALEAIERDALGAGDPARTASRAWSPASPTGCCRASAPGACRSRSSCARGGHEILIDEEVNARIADAFEGRAPTPGSPRARSSAFSAKSTMPTITTRSTNLVDVWFDSGSTHAFVLEDPVHFPGLAGINRKVDGGADEVMYLEGSDQHRGWFQSSLLESCGTRGRAPFDVVLTHGFTLDEKGRKMSKSLGNQTFPQDVIKRLRAPTSCASGRRASTIPTTSASARKS